MPAGHLTLGGKGEDIALRHVRQKGYVLLERNWRTATGELDIICDDGGTLVFIEVKTRTKGPKNVPYEGLTQKKIRILCRTISQYLSEFNMWHRPCRLDFIGIEISYGQTVIQHIENAAPMTMENSWQPW